MVSYGTIYRTTPPTLYLVQRSVHSVTRAEFWTLRVAEVKGGRNQGWHEITTSEEGKKCLDEKYSKEAESTEECWTILLPVCAYMGTSDLCQGVVCYTVVFGSLETHQGRRTDPVTPMTHE